MTYTNYLTKTDLYQAGNLPNLDPTVQQAVLNQLINDGLYDNSNPDDGRGIWVESDIFDGTLAGTQSNPLFNHGGNSTPLNWIQGLEVEGNNVTVQTDATLRVIVDDGVNSGTNTLNVKGDDPVWIGLGNSNTKVNLFDHGNDTVLGGNGSDAIVANDGDDSLVAGHGDTKLVGGSGHDTLVGGSGHDTLLGGSGANYLYGGSGDSTLTAGSGQHSWLQAGSGKTVITDKLSGGADTLVAGSGPDTITGLQGDWFTSSANPTSMPGSGHDVYNVYGSSGNSTIDLGTGSDTVNFFSKGGNDTINNHGGVDTIDFTHSATTFKTDIVGPPTQGTGTQTGDWVIHFNDGQTVTLNAHGYQNGQDAFVLQFKDGTLDLKGHS